MGGSPILISWVLFYLLLSLRNLLFSNERQERGFDPDGRVGGEELGEVEGE